MEITGIFIKISHNVDKTIIRIGNALAWLNGVLLVLIIAQVIMRYFFAYSIVAVDEMQWHLYSVNIMFGLSYAVANNSHIRLDVISGNFSPRRQAKIEIALGLFLTIPVVVVVFMHGCDFFYSSWKIGESSVAPLGLPYRWIVKSFIPIGFLFLGVAIIGRMFRAFALLAEKE
ncbi:MAG: TRAP transporter small permease subunit [Desulfatirhabdiaceae bacterium]